MSITQTAAIAKVRLRLQDRTTRRDGTAISNPRFSDTDIGTALNDAIRDRQPLIQSLDPTWYLSVKDYVGQTDAVAADVSSTVLPVVANEQYTIPSTFKEFVRFVRRDLAGQPTVRLVPHEHQESIFYGASGFFAGFLADYPENIAPTTESVALVTYNHEGTLTNRLRVKPAPASTSYLYRLYYQRKATEPDAAGDTLDCPPPWLEIVCLDAAAELAASVNHAALATIIAMRNAALAAHLDDPGGRNAGPRIIGNARI